MGPFSLIHQIAFPKLPYISSNSLLPLPAKEFSVIRRNCRGMRFNAVAGGRRMTQLIPLATTHREQFLMIVRLHRLANEISDLIGGRITHTFLIDTLKKPKSHFVVNTISTPNDFFR